MSTHPPSEAAQTKEDEYDKKDVGAEEGKDVKEEFKSCINETLSTVCRVVSLKKKKNDSDEPNDTSK
ncbi:hypothetical protein V3C99_017643 [Haemonchus contortus]|uniref:Ovule protein n=1 Tax=Haemonchus placei TaxID=6290 RepID=A0A0N4WAI3_HAEPC|nr:unnamed protein product [Haemonchus placei]